MTDMLDKRQWLSFIDRLVLYHDQPEFLLFYIVAMLKEQKPKFSELGSLESIDEYLQGEKQMNL